MSDAAKNMVVLPHAPERGQDAVQLWAYITIDGEGNESLCGCSVNDQWLAMCFTKWNLVEQFRPFAVEAAHRAPPGWKIVLRAYSQGTDLQEIT